MLKEYFIPKASEYVFVSDFFIEDLIGGAELTTEALYMVNADSCFKLHAHSLTEDIIKKNPGKHWILTNYSKAEKNALIELVTSGQDYSIVEYDYKFCKYRAPLLHILKDGNECQCEKEKSGKFTAALMSKAKNVFFMSEEQRNIYYSKFPSLAKNNNFHIQSSTWAPSDLDYIMKLSNSRKENNGKFAVLQGGSWVKNQNLTEAFCKENKIPYELVPKMPYKDFLKTLSEYKGLVFLPRGHDTCPRLVIEARLMGLDLHINELVQHRNEKWFSGTRQEAYDYIFSRNQAFWEILRK